jgi:hypothetical protein
MTDLTEPGVLRIILVIVLVLASIAALLATPIESGWALRSFACDFGGSPDWLATILNVRHLISFGVLAAVAFLVLKGRPAWIPVLVLIAITAGVELEEAIFGSGHCRVRDMLPDLIAIGLGWLLTWVVLRLLPRAASTNR